MPMRKWSDQEILDAIQRWADEHDGVPPTFRDWVTAGEWWPSAFTVHARCGSWNAALEMLGFEPHKVGGAIRFKRVAEARALRKKGLSDKEIGEKLDASASTIGRVLREVPRPPVERKPRTSAEKREARIAALQKALAKEKR
jgi:hypothetical protein